MNEEPITQDALEGSTLKITRLDELMDSISNIIQYPQMPEGSIQTRDMRGHLYSSSELNYKLSLIQEQIKDYQKSLEYDHKVAENCRTTANSMFPASWQDPMTNQKLYNLAFIKQAVIKARIGELKQVGIEKYAMPCSCRATILCFDYKNRKVLGTKEQRLLDLQAKMNRINDVVVS